VLKISNSVPLSSFLQAERQTRSQRSFLIRTCIHGTMRRFADWFRFLGLWTLQLARHLAVERLVHNAIRELDQLDDRTLADIGITRGEIETAVRNGLPIRGSQELRQHDGTTAPTQERLRRCQVAT
jgi:uncharacterized protein YjiS (DUF1127 family)